MNPTPQKPLVSLVANRADAQSWVSAERIVDASYAGGGWDEFTRRTGDAMRLRGASMQIVMEHVSKLAEEAPIAVYVGNASQLADDCGEELVRYITFWLSFNFRPLPMYLLLQMPSQR